MTPRYEDVASRAGHRCEYCLVPEAVFNLRLEIDHIIPPGSGGADVIENFALACKSCNLFKSDWITGVDPITAETVPLFDPRTMRWHDHFQLETGGRLAGRTPAGRATVALLQWNGSRALAARLLWIRHGLWSDSPSSA